MLPLGTTAPAFTLTNVDDRSLSLDDVRGAKGLCVVFFSNHCPYVKHVRDVFVSIAAAFQRRGIGVVAIASNDPVAYPDDAPDKMRLEHREFAYGFPYLFDASQSVAKAYRAACTPDFFLFDSNLSLVYRGQMDGSRPGNDIPVTGGDLVMAADAMLAQKPINAEQKPSLGCNIKWRAGNEPDYFLHK